MKPATEPKLLNLACDVGTPLYCATEKNRVNAVRTLLELGADPTLTGYYYLTNRLEKLTPETEVICMPLTRQHHTGEVITSDAYIMFQETVLELAQKKGFHKIVALLKAYF